VKVKASRSSPVNELRFLELVKWGARVRWSTGLKEGKLTSHYLYTLSEPMMTQRTKWPDVCGSQPETVSVPLYIRSTSFYILVHGASTSLLL
jgi:hypothetical protein